MLRAGKAWEVVSEESEGTGAESSGCPVFPVAAKSLCHWRLISGDTGVGNRARNSLKYLPRPVL